jgi:hypothetical protein
LGFVNKIFKNNKFGPLLALFFAFFLVHKINKKYKKLMEKFHQNKFHQNKFQKKKSENFLKFFFSNFVWLSCFHSHAIPVKFLERKKLKIKKLIIIMTACPLLIHCARAALITAGKLSL